MTGVLAETRTRRAPTCAAATGSSGRAPARSSRRASWPGARHAGPGRPRPVPSARSRSPVVRRRRSRVRIVRGGRCRTSSSALERSPPGSAHPSARSRCGSCPKGGGRLPPSGTRSTAGARPSTGACAYVPSTRATVAAWCSAAGRRLRLQSGRRLRRPARSRRSSRRCAAVTGCTSTAAPGRQQTPMPRPHGLGLVGDCDQLEVGVGERHDPVGGAVPGVAAALDGCNP